MAWISESGASWRRRRRRQRVALLLGVLVLVLAAGGYSAAYYQGWIGKVADEPAVLPPCPVATAPAVRRQDVRVRVLNSTTRKGLALTAARALRTRGYTIVDVGNAGGKADPGVAVVRFSGPSQAAATLLAADLPGARLQRVSRTDPSIDLVLGVKYTGLRATAAPTAATRAPAPCRTLTPTPRPTASRVAPPTPARTAPPAPAGAVLTRSG